MRELTKSEAQKVSGGNFLYGVIGITGAYETGKAIGGYINTFNESTFGMSTGEALYYTLN